MNHITLTRTQKDITVKDNGGDLGFILGRPGDFEAWANLEPLDGFARAVVEPFKSLKDAVTFITQNGVA